MSNRWYEHQVREDWARARRKAFIESVVDLVTRRPSELVPLTEVQSRLNVRGSRSRGLQQVPLHKIIGSEGRYADFDRRFLPRKTTTEDRWKSVNLARYADVPLPPVELYKVGDVYFVKDGNHRVSVARERGQADIDAYITELEVDVPLDERLSVRDLLLKEEYSDFLEWTGLHRIRPQQRIELSALGGYLEMIEHINTHRYYLSKERDAEVPRDEALASWYDSVYMPVVELIRQHDILAQFPGRTEADLYLWIMKHRSSLHEVFGYDPGPEVAALDYATQFGHRSLLETVGEAAQSLAGGARVALSSTKTAPSLELLSFVEWAKADQLCDGATIRLSNNNDYARLREHVVAHHYFMGQDCGHEVSFEEAIKDWCAHWYLPVVEEVHKQGTLQYFPHMTDTDLYLWIMDHLHYRRQAGQPLDIAAATAEVTRQASSHSKTPGRLTRIVNRVKRFLHVAK